MFVGDNDGGTGSGRGYRGRYARGVGLRCHMVSASGVIGLGLEGAWLSISFCSGAYWTRHGVWLRSVFQTGKKSIFRKTDVERTLRRVE